MTEEHESLNLGEVKGFSVHIDAATAQRIKKYRLHQLKENPNKPLIGVPMIVRFAINQWLNEQEE